MEDLEFKLSMEDYGLRLGTQDLRIRSGHTDILHTYSCSSFVAKHAILRTLYTYEFTA